MPLSEHVPSRHFLRQWVIVTLAGASLVSVADGLLLQRSKSFFTGGFLTIDYLNGPGEIALFIVISLAVDAAVVGGIAAVVIWLLRRMRLRAAAVMTGALAAGAGSLIVADIVSYEIGRYVGDVLDLSLTMELAGGDIREIAAVTSSHFFVPGLLIAGAGGATGGVVWLLNRRSSSGKVTPCAARVLVIPALTVAAGLVLSILASEASDSIQNGLLRKPSGKVLALAADTLTDFDRDGYGIAGRMGDPDLFDADVFPYGIDIPGNGIDENAVGGDLPAGSVPYLEPRVSTEPWQRRPDVVLVVLESFRADVVGLHEGGVPVTPVLDAIAARGVSARHAYSHNGYTAPSRYHLFSGSLLGGRDDRTLVDDFKANGYFVGYFSGQDESFGGARMAVGFDRADHAYDARADRDRRYSTFTTAGSLAVSSRVVQERVGEFLSGYGTQPTPLFLYVNFHDTHFPYTHDDIETLTSAVRLPRSAIVPEQREALWQMYANTASNVDRAIGELLDAVEAARGRRPAVIVTADHGESLFDEDFLGHGYALNDVQTRVPFVVADLPMAVQEPFAQSDLRDALSAALRVAPGAPAAPRLTAAPERELFQYLGNLTRPRQIAFLRLSGRTVYDFRSRRVTFAAGPWRDPDALDQEERKEFLRLIHTWERMMLARPSAVDDES